jgi:hypothetical protein
MINSARGISANILYNQAYLQNDGYSHIRDYSLNREKETVRSALTNSYTIFQSKYPTKYPTP